MRAEVDCGAPLDVSIEPDRSGDSLELRPLAGAPVPPQPEVLGSHTLSGRRTLRALDFGGCRCQAFALTGDARNADPVCTLTPARALIDAAIAAAESSGAYRYRHITLTPART